MALSCEDFQIKVKRFYYFDLTYVFKLSQAVVRCRFVYKNYLFDYSLRQRAFHCFFHSILTLW